MNQPPGDPYGGNGRPGGTIPGGPPLDINAPPPQEPGRAPVAPTMVDQAVPASPAMAPPPMMQPGMPYAPQQPMPQPMAPMGQPGMPPMGHPGMGAPMPGAPLGAPYGVAPPMYQRRQKSNLPVILGVVLGGMAMVAVVGGIAIFARRSDAEPADSGPIVLPTATEPVNVAPTDTPPAETTPPPEETAPTATATSTYTPPKSTATSTAKTPATATATAKPPATATATSTSTAKPPATTTATATNTSKTPPGGRPPPIRIKR